MLAFVPIMVTAQTFDFDLTKSQPMYTDARGYGYEFEYLQLERNTATGSMTNRISTFYFSVRVPDGNYLVRVVLGGVKNGNTTVRAEGRRLMMDNILTPK